MTVIWEPEILTGCTQYMIIVTTKATSP